MADKIYVILHGLISLAEESTNDQFRAILIDMPDHRVAAGHWLTEMTIPKGALLQLTNVARDTTPPRARLDSTTNIIFPRTPTSLSDPSPIDRAQRNKYRYAEIILPWPTTITSLNTTNISSDLVNAPAGATSISDTQVFEYDVLAGKRPSLVGDSTTPWSGMFFFVANLGSTTMHILNEPDAGAEGDHVMEEFRRSAEIFNSPARLKTGSIVGDYSHGVPDSLAPHLLHEEALPLAERQERVFNMAGEARKRPPVGYVTRKGSTDGSGGGLVCSGGHGNGN